MKGAISVQIKNNKNEYEFTLKRNITVLCGNSGTGKTTLYNMVRNYMREGRASGVRAKTTNNVPLAVLEGNFWDDEIEKINDSIVLVDEDSSFIRSEDFAKKVQNNSNYFLLITRNYLYQLPYSVNEIYEVKGRKKKHFERLYLDRELIYAEPNTPAVPFKPEVVITEDSNSGYEFFKNICNKSGIECVSAKGKSKILKCAKNFAGKRIAVIADGAAFGAEIGDLAEIQKISNGTLALYLPESFEWLILKSGAVCNPEADEIVHTENYAESSKYFSWERYFFDFLAQQTASLQYAKYSKDKLNNWYAEEPAATKILSVMKAMEI